MSGTSLDGIDAAFILSDGVQIVDKGPFKFLPYDREFRQELKQCLGQSQRTSFVRQVERQLTLKHGEFALEIMESSGIKPQLIGFHGQTIFHAPPQTLQIGDGELLANLTGVRVVYDFRTNDCRNGGQSAPLVPIYHQALAHDFPKPIAFVNIGGIANITYIGISDELIAFDTGPGNALIDDYVLTNYGIPFDTGGAIAATGIPNQKLVQTWLADPFFSRSYPKSLDRDHFTPIIASLAGISQADAVATLTLFTTETIALACKELPTAPHQMIVCGGGAKNQTMIAFLKKNLRSIRMTLAQNLGLRGDFIEAEAFAFLALRSFYGLPISFPLTTGVKVPLTGGIVTQSVLDQGGSIG